MFGDSLFGQTPFGSNAEVPIDVRLNVGGMFGAATFGAAYFGQELESTTSIAIVVPALDILSAVGAVAVTANGQPVVAGGSDDFHVLWKMYQDQMAREAEETDVKGPPSKRRRIKLLRAHRDLTPPYDIEPFLILVRAGDLRAPISLRIPQNLEPRLDIRGGFDIRVPGRRSLRVPIDLRPVENEPLV